MVSGGWQSGAVHYQVTVPLMYLSTISIIQLVVIAILLIVIVDYEIERRNMKYEARLLYSDMGFRLSAHIERTLNHVNAMRHKLSAELYVESPKKNAIVKEICDLFYQTIKSQIKSPR